MDEFMVKNARSVKKEKDFRNQKKPVLNLVRCYRGYGAFLFFFATFVGLKSTGGLLERLFLGLALLWLLVVALYPGTLPR